jgi:Ankyrin repeats (3 copies)
MSVYVGWEMDNGYIGRGTQLVDVEPSLFDTPDVRHFPVYPHEVEDFDKKRQRRIDVIKTMEELEQSLLTGFDNKKFKIACYQAVDDGLGMVKLMLRSERRLMIMVVKNILLAAASFGRFDIVKFLFEEHRDDVNTVSVIQNAAENGHLDIVKLLFEDLQLDVSASVQISMEHAAKNGHSEVVKLLLSKRVDVGTISKTIYEENGDFHIIRYRNLQPVDLRGYINSALELAAENGHLEVVKLLLADERLDIKNTDEAFRRAVKNRHDEITKLIREKAGW